MKKHIKVLLALLAALALVFAVGCDSSGDSGSSSTSEKIVTIDNDTTYTSILSGTKWVYDSEEEDTKELTDGEIQLLSVTITFSATGNQFTIVPLYRYKTAANSSIQSIDGGATSYYSVDGDEVTIAITDQNSDVSNIILKLDSSSYNGGQQLSFSADSYLTVTSLVGSYVDTFQDKDTSGDGNFPVDIFKVTYGAMVAGTSRFTYTTD